MKPIRTYEVSVDGYAPALYSARSPGKARARAWREFTTMFEKSFHEFLVISRVRRVADPPGVYRRVMIAGLPATTVHSYRCGSIWFMRDDSDVVLCAHPLDVSSMPAERAAA